MCIGLPMQIIETRLTSALCKGMGMEREVDTLFVGGLSVGTWVLVFLNSAREVLCEESAAKITQAIQAVTMITSDEITLSSEGLGKKSIDALFSDLIDREPQKPPSLIAFEQSRQAANGDE